MSTVLINNCLKTDERHAAVFLLFEQLKLRKTSKMHTQFFKFPFVGFLLIEIINFRYDAEATYFDEGVRSAKRKQLEEKLLQVIHLHPILQLND